MRSFTNMLFSGAILCALVGCGGEDKGPKTVPAEGTITLDGDPIDGAAIVLVAADGQYPASGQSDQDGHFSLDAFEWKPGAVPGTYMVSIVKNEEITEEPPKKMKGDSAEHSMDDSGNVQLGVRNALPEKFRNPNPNFQITIPDDGVKDLKIELAS